MSKLINYNSVEGKVLKEFFQENMIDPYIALIVESYIYKEVIEYYDYTGAPYPVKEQIKEKYMTKYGKIEGLYQFWYEDNQFDIHYIECTYKNGKREGLFQSWYKNGQKWQECNFKEGEEEGIFHNWYKSGKKYIERNYKKGKREGLYQSWHENGQYVVLCNYKDDRYDGLYQTW